MRKLTSLLIIPAVCFGQYESTPVQGLVDFTGSTPLYLGDDNTRNFQLGFPFTFDDQKYNNVWVSSNGFLSFSTSNNLCCAGSPITNSRTPVGIFGVWTDLISGPNPYLKSTNDMFLVTWDHTFEYGTNRQFTFQIQLNSDDSFSIRYGTIPNLAYHVATAGYKGVTNFEELNFGSSFSSLSNTGYIFSIPKTEQFTPVVIYSPTEVTNENTQQTITTTDTVIQSADQSTGQEPTGQESTGQSVQSVVEQQVQGAVQGVVQSESGTTQSVVQGTAQGTPQQEQAQTQVVQGSTQVVSQGTVQGSTQVTETVKAKKEDTYGQKLTGVPTVGLFGMSSSSSDATSSVDSEDSTFQVTESPILNMAAFNFNSNSSSGFDSFQIIGVQDQNYQSVDTQQYLSSSSTNLINSDKQSESFSLLTTEYTFKNETMFVSQNTDLFSSDQQTLLIQMSVPVKEKEREKSETNASSEIGSTDISSYDKAKIPDQLKFYKSEVPYKKRLQDNNLLMYRMTNDPKWIKLRDSQYER